MRTFFTLHRWFGWVLGPFLVVSAVTGLTLLWLQPLPVANQVARAPAQLARAIDRGLSDLARDHQALTLSYIDLPRAGEPIRIRLVPRQSAGEEFWAELDPATGQVVGVLADGSNAHAWLFNLHHQWLLGDAGSWPVGAVGLLAIVSLLIALRLWLRVRKLRAPTPWRHWHRRVGIVMYAPLLVTLATGFVLSWPEAVRPTLALMAGESRFKAPVANAPKVPAQALSPGQALEVGAAQLPGAVPTRLYAAKAGSYRLRLRADEWHPNGLNSVYLSAHGGAVLRIVHWRELPLSTRYANVVYPLHIGWLPGSPTTSAAVALRLVLSASAVALVWLVLSGLRWRTRHHARPSGRAA